MLKLPQVGPQVGPPNPWALNLVLVVKLWDQEGFPGL